MITIIATIFSDIVRNKWHRRDSGTRSYGWVKDKLQEAGAVPRAKGRGRRRKRRERAPWPGMLLHQDGSTREWVEGRQWDLIVTMDDATSERCSMFLCEQEGTWSSFRGVREARACSARFARIGLRTAGRRPTETRTAPGRRGAKLRCGKRQALPAPSAAEADSSICC